MHTPESVEPPEPVAPATEPAGFSPDSPPTESDEAAPLVTPVDMDFGAAEAVAEPETAVDGQPTAEPLSVPGPDADSAIAAALSRIEAQLGESQRLLDRQAEISAKLHAENQVLRAGELRKAQTG